MTTYKNREMATGPFPTSVTRRPVTVETSWSGGRYNSRTVGHRAMIQLSDGSEVACCERPNGHRSDNALKVCAALSVETLNEAAGIPAEVR